jgi:hypothetical protein
VEGLRNSVGITPVMGTLFGVVVSSITGEWWWIGLGFAVGLGLEAIKRRAGRES